MSKTELIQALAGKYIWWETPEKACMWPERVIAQVMNLGDFDDAKALLETFGGPVFIKTLKEAEAGWFNQRSWHYWHYRLNNAALGGVPPLPVRHFRA